MNFYAICSALPKEEDSTSSVFFEIVKTPVNDSLSKKIILAETISVIAH